MLLSLGFVLLGSHLILAVAKSTARSGSSSPSKGFGISRPSKEKSQGAFHNQISKFDLEDRIQFTIDQCHGLREAMKVYDDLQNHENSLKNMKAIDKLQLSASYDDIIMRKKHELSNLESMGWSKESIRNKLLEITWDSSASFREERHKSKNDFISNNVANHMNAVAKHAYDMLHYGPLCDVGCGTGVVFDFIVKLHDNHEIGSSFHGVDLSAEMINICRRKYPTSSLHRADFMSFSSSMRFGCIIFNVSLLDRFLLNDSA